MYRHNEGPFRNLLLLAVAGAVCLSTPAFASMVISPTFTTNFVTDFGSNAVAAENAWNAAASIFATNFSDNIHIQITVDAQPGTSIFGQSNTFLDSTSYSNLRNLAIADAKTPNDAIATGAGGSVTAADPTSGAGTWWVTTAEAKAIGLMADSSLNNDGTTTFGAGNAFTFSGSVAPGTFDFQGVAAHEISEVLGRLGLSGGTVGSTTNSYSMLDLFSYTGAGTRGLTPGPSENFSIDNGTTLLKLFNDASANHLDSRDWAPGTNDAFNQFSNSGVTNPVTLVDLQLLDVLGYDLIEGPEPSTMLMMSLGGLAMLGAAWRKRRGSLKT